MKKYMSFFLFLFLLVILGVNYKYAYVSADDACEATKVTASPSSTNIKVGERVKFTLIDNCGKSVDTNAGWVAYDPFFLKQDSLNPGTFEALNPGSTELVKTTMGGVYELHVPVTITGTAPTTSGKVKITTSKFLTPTLFPQLSSCLPSHQGVFGSQCITVVTNMMGHVANSGREQDTIKIFDQARIPGLVMGEMDWGGGIERNLEGPNYYDITDPMNPKKVQSLSQYRLTDSGVCSGDWGGKCSPVAMGFSNDLSYAGVDIGFGTSRLFGSGYEDGSGVILGAGGMLPSQILFAQHGGNTYIIGPKTDPSYPKSAMNLSNILPHTPSKLETETGLHFITTALPSNFPSLHSGTKEVLTGDGHVAVLAGFSYDAATGVRTSPNKVEVYNLDKPAAVASVTIKKDKPSTAGSYYSPQWPMIVRLPATGADYLFVYINYETKNTSGKIEQGYILSTYKFTFATEKLETVVNGLNVTGEFADSLVGVLVGNKPAVMTFSRTSPVSSASSKSAMKVYMVSDLASGKVQNVLANPIAQIGRVNTAVSYVKGSSTYVYFISGNGGDYDNIRVLKLDSSTVTTPTIVPPTINPNVKGCSSAGPYNVLTGKLCPVVTTVDCAAGDLFSVLTGKACPAPAAPLITTETTDCPLILGMSGLDSYTACMHDKLLNLQNQ